jgi:hypothetical protein
MAAGLDGDPVADLAEANITVGAYGAAFTDTDPGVYQGKTADAGILADDHVFLDFSHGGIVKKDLWKSLDQVGLHLHPQEMSRLPLVGNGTG